MADIGDKYEQPGLPVWLNDLNTKFSKIIILVQTDSEAIRIVNQLKEQMDSSYHDYGWEYDTKRLSATHVISIESLKEFLVGSDIQTVRFEDLPSRKTGRKVRTVKASEEVLKRAEIAVAKAYEAATIASKEYCEKTPKESNGWPTGDVYGFANVIVGKEFSHREELAALLELKLAEAIGGIGYFIGDFTQMCRSHLLGEEEASARAASDILNELLGDIFGVRSKLD